MSKKTRKRRKARKAQRHPGFPWQGLKPREVLACISDVLWPDGDTNVTWATDEVARVAELLVDNGFANADWS